MQSNNVDETLETAKARNFVVSMQTRAGFQPFEHKVIVVTAYSIKGAKAAAIKKMKKGRHQYTRAASWVFKSVQDATEGVSK